MVFCDIIDAMKRVVKHYFVPHEGNEYKPHFFREFCVIATLVVLVVLFGLSSAVSTFFKYTDSGAAIYTAFLVELTNSDRAKENLGTLSTSALLIEAAKRKAEDMSKYSYFAHNSPRGITPWHWFDEVGYTFVYAGENLAVDFNETAAVERAWMRSPTHRENILNKNFTEIGIATADGVLDGKPTIFVVQMFGKPAAAAETRVAAVAVASENQISSSTQNMPSVPERKPLAVAAPKPKPAPVVPQLETVTDNPTFVVVKNTTAIEASTTPTVGAVSGAEAEVLWYEKMILEYPKAVHYTYTFISLLVLLALLLMIFIEIKTQHPKNIIYAVLLLVITGGLMYLNKAFVLPFI
jgi:uncharacterized protein YkwD